MKNEEERYNLIIRNILMLALDKRKQYYSNGNEKHREERSALIDIANELMDIRDDAI